MSNIINHYGKAIRDQLLSDTGLAAFFDKIRYEGTSLVDSMADISAVRRIDVSHGGGSITPSDTQMVREWFYDIPYYVTLHIKAPGLKPGMDMTDVVALYTEATIDVLMQQTITDGKKTDYYLQEMGVVPVAFSEPIPSEGTTQLYDWSVTITVMAKLKIFRRT